MSEKKERIYVGSGVEKFEGNLINSTICLTDIEQNAADYVFEFNGKKYIKVKVQKKKEADQYGKTHFVEVDTWKPEAKSSQPVESTNDDLPF
tara:strand:- start:139 stop:414 length:276 start_codon:yes stop_codon:yes gene_type:complete